MPNQPEVTAPVSRGRNASTGTIMNYGTAKGGNAGGSNASVGGSTSNGNQSTNQIPVSPIATEKDVFNGASATASTSSQNPPTIQSVVDVTAKNSEYVARTSDGANSSVDSGYHSNLPSHNATPTLPTSDNEYNTELGEKTFARTGKGLETSREFGSNSDDLDRIATNAGVIAQNPNASKQDSNGTGERSTTSPHGSPTPQIREDLLDGETNPDFPEILGQ